MSNNNENSLNGFLVSMVFCFVAFCLCLTIGMGSGRTDLQREAVKVRAAHWVVKDSDGSTTFAWNNPPIKE